MSIPGSASPLFFTAAADAAAFTLERSVRFDNDSSAHLKRTPSSAGDQQTWTWSAWIKGCTGVNDQVLFFSGDYNAANDYVYFGIMNTGFFRVEIRDGTTLSRNNTNNLLRDPAAWYHIVVQANFSASAAADRMNVWINNEEVSWLADDRSDISTSFNYAINKSGKEHVVGALKDGSPSKLFNGYMADVYLIDGSALDPTSFGAYDDNGVWQAAAYSGSFGTNGFHLDFADNSTAAALGTDTSGNGNDWSVSNFSVSQGDQVYSSGASYEGNAVLYSNEPAGAFGKPGIPDWGVTYSPSGSPSLTSGGKITFPTAITNVTSVVINYKVSGGSGSVFINDNSTGITNLGSTSYVEVDVTSLLSNSSTSTTLSSIIFGPGNQNYGMRLKYIEVNGVRLTDSTYNYLNDSLFDSPTNGDSSDDSGAGGEVSGNYCTWNPLEKHSTIALADGNLDASSIPSSAWLGATFAMTSGKWYYEVTTTVGQYLMLGVADYDAAKNDDKVYTNTGTYYYYGSNGQLRVNGTNTAFPNSTTYTYSNNAVIGIAFDCDNGTVNFYLNGSKVGGSSDSITGLTGKRLGPALSAASGSQSCVANFGARSFTHSAPSGYKPLCSTLLPTPTIADGSDYFDVKLWTGNSSTNTISGLEFSPDWVWIKGRSNAVHSAVLDTVRGANKYLYSSLANAEVGGYTDILTSFNSDGFTLGADSSNQVNYTGYTYCGWCWDAGSSTASNTDGSITSQVRANQTAGFSIVSYAGALSSAGSSTVGHGLNAAPSLVIVKNRDDGAEDWVVFHESLGNAAFVRLNQTNAQNTGSSMWGSTSPTSSVFTVGYSAQANISGDNHIAYCFAPVANYSQFGVYEGNGSNDGPFIYTGFRPALVILKRIDSTASWYLYDYKRDGYNAANKLLYPNLSNAEANNHIPDFLSNGFKIRTVGTVANGSGNDYIYMAWAENPFSSNGGLAR